MIFGNYLDDFGIYWNLSQVMSFWGVTLFEGIIGFNLSQVFGELICGYFGKWEFVADEKGLGD